MIVPTEGQWRFDFQRDGQPLTESEPQAVGLFTQDGKTYLREQLSLQVGETVYGLGERFGPFVKNGQSIDMWNEDGGTDSELAYKNVPFYLTSQGYGVLVNHPGRVSYEIASHHVQRVQFSVEGHSLDYYVFGGPTMKDALDQYTALSGRPALLPEWSFRAVAVHVVHHQLQRAGHPRQHRAHGRGGYSDQRVPLRLLLDERTDVVQLFVGSALFS